MKFAKFFKLDLQTNIRLILLAVVLGAVVCVASMLATWLHVVAVGFSISTYTFADNLFSLFGGLLPLPFDDLSRQRFPIVWLLCLVAGLYCPLAFIPQSLRYTGPMQVMLGRSRAAWLGSKMAFVLLLSVIYWMAIYACLAVFTQLTSANFSIHASASLSMVLIPQPYVLLSDSANLSAFALTLPAVACVFYLGIAMISLFIKPLVSFVLALCALIPALFAELLFLPGTYMMAVRTAAVIQGGQNAVATLAICACVLALTVVLAQAAFSKMDFLGGIDTDD
jgi:hypothetical protein